MTQKLWLNKPSDIVAGLTMIRGYHKGPACPIIENDYLGHMEEFIEYYREAIVSGSRATIEWKGVFSDVGLSALRLLGDQFDEVKFIEMLLGKHRRYGLKSLMGWREIGILSRIDQKVARAMTMRDMDNKTDFGDETVYDTLADIVGYCVIGFYMMGILPEKTVV